MTDSFVYGPRKGGTPLIIIAIDQESTPGEITLEAWREGGER